MIEQESAANFGLDSTQEIKRCRETRYCHMQFCVPHGTEIPEAYEIIEAGRWNDLDLPLAYPTEGINLYAFYHPG